MKFKIPTSLTIDWQAEQERIINRLRGTGALVAQIDLFCGAGGWTYGSNEAETEGIKFSETILGINHDWLAIACHKAVHKHTLHLVEDIREVAMKPIQALVKAIRKALPYIVIVVQMSAECIFHSKANGGNSRDADSRSLAEELYRYENAIRPDLIFVENVVEFRNWGPVTHKQINLDGVELIKYPYQISSEFGILFSKNKKEWIDIVGYSYKRDKKKGITPWTVPIKERKKEFFDIWVNKLKKRGYKYEDRDINSADLGAYQSRLRYFGTFSKKISILHPEQTHAKDPQKHFSKTGNMLLKHRAVKDVLNMVIKGDSLFTPGRIDSDATFGRVFGGGVKFIANGKENYEKDKSAYLKGITELKDIHNDFLPFLVQFNNNCDAQDINEPSRVLTNKEKFAFTSFDKFLYNKNSSTAPCVGTNNPSPAVTQRTHCLVGVERFLPFLANYHGTGHNCQTTENTSNTITAADTHSILFPQPFIMRDFSGGGFAMSVEVPAGTAMPFPKMNLVNPEAWIMDTNFSNTGTSIEDTANTLLASRHHPYLVNPSCIVNDSYKSNGSSIEKPAPTVIARQDKSPLHLAQMEYGDKTVIGIIIYETDTPKLKELKQFMAVYEFADIKMRMLMEEELLPIQGLPKWYFEAARSLGIKVPVTAAKKYIGNAVEATTAQAMIEVYGPYFYKRHKKYKLKIAA